MPARTRIIAVFSMPSFIAIASAVLKPMPRMSRARRYGFSVMTWTASAPYVLKMRTARAVPTPWLCRKTLIPHDLLLGPGTGDPLGAHGADTGHLAQAVGLRLDHVEHFLAERLDHL